MSSRITPLPWHCGDNGLIYGQCTGHDDEVPCVADVIADRERAASGIMTDVECSNVEFIVQACNAHHALVNAARFARRLCDLIERWADAEDSVDCAELMAEIVGLAQSHATVRTALTLAGCPIVEPSASTYEKVHS